MSKELIERLRADAESTDDIGLCADAADRIEELERELQEAKIVNDHNLHVYQEAAKVMRDQRDALQADNARLRESLYDTLYFLERHSNRWDGVNGKHPNDVAEAAREALATTPEQSLARIRNQVREEAAAKVADAWDYDKRIASAIRASKERMMNRAEFKKRWESDDRGGGITFDDIAECAKAWGLYTTPKTCYLPRVTYHVLRAADTVDAESYNPDKECDDDVDD